MAAGLGMCPWDAEADGRKAFVRSLAAPVCGFGGQGDYKDISEVLAEGATSSQDTVPSWGSVEVWGC